MKGKDLLALLEELIPVEKDHRNSPFSQRTLKFLDGYNDCRNQIIEKISEMRRKIGAY